MLLLTLFALVTVAHARINVTYLRVPEEVSPKQNEVEFECRYEGNFTILNWFKGPNEFFRYKPGAAPTIRSFPVLGVGKVEMVYCGPTECRLRLSALTDEATGLYRCDIERKSVPYKFASKSAYMRVYGHEHRQPLLEGLAEEFGPDDEIQAYCRAERNSEVRWYINELEIRSMRGARTFKYKSSRLLFAGSPPTLTMQCAEMIDGKLSGSKRAKAQWKSMHGYVDQTAQEQKTAASTGSATKTNIQILCVECFLIFFLCVTFKIV